LVERPVPDRDKLNWDKLCQWWLLSRLLHLAKAFKTHRLGRVGW
jgi:hypothetical protein